MLLLALMLCLSAAGAENRTGEAERMLVPVGHTAGVKLFARGVLVVRLPEDDSPAKEGGLKEGDVILACDGNPITSTEHFQALIQKTGSKQTAVLLLGSWNLPCLQAQRGEMPENLALPENSS